MDTIKVAIFQVPKRELSDFLDVAFKTDQVFGVLSKEEREELIKAQK